jgi:cell division topological specificity factor
VNLLDFFKRKPKTASVAKERLQILVAHERTRRNAPSYLPQLKNDIIEVVKRYVDIGPDAITVNIEKHEQTDMLELNITLPEK